MQLGLYYWIKAEIHALEIEWHILAIIIKDSSQLQLKLLILSNKITLQILQAVILKVECLLLLPLIAHFVISIIVAIDCLCYFLQVEFNIEEHHLAKESLTEFLEAVRIVGNDVLLLNKGVFIEKKCCSYKAVHQLVINIYVSIHLCIDRINYLSVTIEEFRMCLCPSLKVSNETPSSMCSSYIRVIVGMLN